MIETLKDRRSLVQASLWFLSLSLALFGIWRYWQAQGDRSYVVDEAVYTYVGWSWGQNYWPYVESWDHKGPLVYATTMLRTKIADTNAEALAGQEIVLGTVTALLLAGIAHQLWGGTGAALALALSILLWSQKPPEHGHMSTPGSLITLFTSGAILASLYSARRASFRSMAVLAVVMGVSIGMAVSTKPNALTGLAVGLGVLWWIPRGLQSSRRLMLTLSSLVGAAVPPLAVAAAFYRVGALGELVDNYLVYNTVRGKLILQNGIPTLAISTLKSLNHVDILPLMVAFPAAVILALIYRRSTAQKGEQPSYVGAVIALSWLVLDLGLVVSSGGYRHQVYTVFPAAALGGVWLIQAAARGSDLSSRSLPLVIFLLLFVPLVLSAGSMRPPFDTAGSRSPDLTIPSSRWRTGRALHSWCRRTAVTPVAIPTRFRCTRKVMSPMRVGMRSWKRCGTVILRR